MSKILCINLILLMILFLGTSSPIDSTVMPTQNREDPLYSELPKSERLQKQLDDLRTNNIVTLKYIKFKAEFGDFDEYYNKVFGKQ